MSNTRYRYTVYDNDRERFVVPLFFRADGPPIGFILETGKTYTAESLTGKLYTGKEPDLLYGEVIDRMAELENMAEENEHLKNQIKQMRDFIEQLTTSRNCITYTQREKVYREAIEVHGSTVQQIVALEELSEAQKEICKLLRSQGSLDHLAEEVADATIVLEQVRLIHGINDLVNKKMDEKVERLRRNLAAVRAERTEEG